jgi:hypothetical protein
VKPTQWAGVSIQVDMNQHVTLTCSRKDFANFAKNSAPSDVMQLMMSNDVPLLVGLDQLAVVEIVLISVFSWHVSCRWPSGDK